MSTLKQVRQAMGLSQPEMGQLLGGIHDMTVSRVEAGKSKLTPFYVAAIAMMHKNIVPGVAPAGFSPGGIFSSSVARWRPLSKR